MSFCFSCLWCAAALLLFSPFCVNLIRVFIIRVFIIRVFIIRVLVTFCAIYFISFPANGDYSFISNTAIPLLFYSFISNTPIPLLFDLSPSLFMDDHPAFIALLSVWLSVRLRCTCLGGAGVPTRDEVSTDGTLALETRNVFYILIIARKRSCGKVMFSQAFVCSREGVHA